MEVLLLTVVFMLSCSGVIVSTVTAIPETKVSEELSELKNFLTDRIHEIENRYDEKFEALRDEMTKSNAILLKSIDELNDKLKVERMEKSDVIQRLEKEFSAKETELTTEIEDLKKRLTTERNDRNREVDSLKMVISTSMSERRVDLNMPKERGFKRQLSLYGSAPVAFSARLSNNTPSLNPNKEIIFNDVLLNVGSAYNSSRGSFFAPVPGVYYFTTSLLAYGTTSHHAKLVKNGVELARADFNDADSFDHSSQSVIVVLKTGDMVAVQNADYTNMVYHGNNYSTFSGFLLYEYEDVSPVVGK